MGKCPSCSAWNSFEEQQSISKQVSASKQLLMQGGNKVKLGSVNTKDLKRISTRISEFDTALTGGLVSEQVILFAGEPGVGKSTLLLQAAANLSSQGITVMYASGEESAAQVANRAERLLPKKSYMDLEFIGAASVQRLLGHLEEEKPAVVIVDSIQTMFDESLNSLPGSLSQIKSCTSSLVTAAKTQGFILMLVGHINKSGDIAGPKVLEHLVDTVLQLEGARDGEYRVLRVLKNRFGSTAEVGLLVMTEQGLVDLQLEHSVLAGGNENAVGTAKTLAIEGNRAVLIEVQALTNETVFAYPKRVAEGISISRLQLICAILDRFAGTSLGSKDVYVRTAGGYRLQHPLSDLAIAAAILSSVHDKELPHSTVFVGELTLSGKSLLPSALTRFLKGLEKQGVQQIVAPLGKSTDVSKLIKLSENYSPSALKKWIQSQ
jgi:DNA repair protein RadA/Sms